MKPESFAASPHEIRIAPGWFWFAVIGIAMNLAGGLAWLGVGPALFISGALTVGLSSSWIALFLWFSARVVAARTVEQPAGKHS